MRTETIACCVAVFAAFAAMTKSNSQDIAHDPNNQRRMEMEEILAHMSIVNTDDGHGGTAKTLRISGLNVQIVNGTEKTIGEHGAGNGLGNLIVGYNEPGNPLGDDRTGSHNIVVGSRNSFRGSGSLVAGEANFAGATFCAVLGGNENIATGSWSSVVGGQKNEASGSWSSILGGEANETHGSWSAATGGKTGVARESWQITPAK
jgi:hypothetical protein